MLAHDAACPALGQPLHDGLGAEMPVADPHLLGLGTLDQRYRARALTLVRILTGHDVAHQRAVWVVHHQRMARQCRTAKPAQRR